MSGGHKISPILLVVFLLHAILFDNCCYHFGGSSGVHFRILACPYVVMCFAFILKSLAAL